METDTDYVRIAEVKLSHNPKTGQQHMQRKYIDKEHFQSQSGMSFEFLTARQKKEAARIAPKSTPFPRLKPSRDEPDSDFDIVLDLPEKDPFFPTDASFVQERFENYQIFLKARLNESLASQARQALDDYTFQTQTVHAQFDFYDEQFWFSQKPDMPWWIQDDLLYQRQEAVKVSGLQPGSAVRKNADTVAKVQVRFTNIKGYEITQVCSGNTISKDLIILNDHCFSPNPDVNYTGIYADFNYEDYGQISKQYFCGEIVLRDTALDVAVIRCDDNPGEDYGWAVLSDRPLLDEDEVYTISHPAGYHFGINERLKRVSTGHVKFSQNYPFSPTDYYTTLTSYGGSSGALIFSKSTHKAVLQLKANGVSNRVTIGTGMSFVLQRLKDVLSPVLTHQVSYFKNKASREILPEFKGKSQFGRVQLSKETQILKSKQKKLNVKFKSKDVIDDLPIEKITENNIKKLASTTSYAKISGIIKRTNTEGQTVSIEHGNECGATNISPDHIITAAHCVESNFQKMQIQFNFNLTSTSKAQYNFTCKDIVIFDREFDIAILKCGGRPGEIMGYAKISKLTPKSGESIMAIHHAQGAPQRVVRNLLLLGSEAQPIKLNVDFQTLFFSRRDTETVKGASGSGIFNQFGEIIAALSGSVDLPTANGGKRNHVAFNSAKKYFLHYPKGHKIRDFGEKLMDLN